MTTLFTLLIGVIGGFLIHALTMKVNFKQRTIENKIRVYDSIITQWVRARNFIYSQLPNDPHSNPQFDIMYGESQAFIGEAILVSEDTELTENIDSLNERLYRTDWAKISHEKANEIMEDIKDSTRFEIKDFFHIISGFRK